MTSAQSGMNAAAAMRTHWRILNEIMWNKINAMVYAVASGFVRAFLLRCTQITSERENKLIAAMVVCRQQAHPRQDCIFCCFDSCPAHSCMPSAVNHFFGSIFSRGREREREHGGRERNGIRHYRGNRNESGAQLTASHSRIVNAIQCRCGDHIKHDDTIHSTRIHSTSHCVAFTEFRANGIKITLR